MGSENFVNLEKLKRWENSTPMNTYAAVQFAYNCQLFYCHIFAQLKTAFKDPIVNN